jgi:hypothetical protein
VTRISDSEPAIAVSLAVGRNLAAIDAAKPTLERLRTTRRPPWLVARAIGILLLGKNFVATAPGVTKRFQKALVRRCRSFATLVAVRHCSVF